MSEQKKKTILEMMQYTLLMAIFTAVLIGGSMVWESRSTGKEEHAILTVQDAKRIKWAQISQYRSGSIVFDGEEIKIGERE